MRSLRSDELDERARQAVGGVGGKLRARRRKRIYEPYSDGDTWSETGTRPRVPLRGILFQARASSLDGDDGSADAAGRAEKVRHARTPGDEGGANSGLDHSCARPSSLRPSV